MSLGDHRRLREVFMEISKQNNRIFPDFSPRAGAVALFSLTALLGALAIVFCDVPLAAAVATPVLAAVVFAAIREPLSVCAIILPAFLGFSVTGSLSTSVLWLGATLCTVSVAFTVLGRRYLPPLISAVLAYAAAAIVIGPVAALAVLVPFILGFTAGSMLPRLDLTSTVTVMSTLLAAILFGSFIALGGNIAESAEALRTEIVKLYLETEQELIVITRDVAEKMAAMMVNLLPGIFFVAVSVLCYVCCISVNSVLRIAGLRECIPESMRRLTLSPVSGLIYVLGFICSLIFGSMTGKLEMVAAVSDNLILCISPAFLVVGCLAARDHVAKKVSRVSFHSERIATGCIAATFLMIPSLAVAAYIGVGVGYTLIPLYRYLINKIKSQIKK